MEVKPGNIEEGTEKPEAQKEVGSKPSLHVEVDCKLEVFIICVVMT